MERITLGAGCFWCVESIFQRIDGVVIVKSGYMGGNPRRISYEEICKGDTGHAEVVDVMFDPEVVTVESILRVFFEAHDPTTLNRQGGDIGTQYRSVIFYSNDIHRLKAQKLIKELDTANLWENSIVTEITKASEFFAAEDYHQNYFALNAEQPYCQLVIKPKIEKFEKVFKKILK